MQLRPDLVFEKDVDASGDPIIVICDPLIRRFFSLPAQAELVLDRLRAPADVDELVKEFETTFDPGEIHTLVRGLVSNGLVAGEGSSAALRVRLRDQHRADQWSAMQRLIRHAAEHIPVYRAKLGDTPVGAIETPSDLLRLPPLTKADIRAHYPDGFVPAGTDLASLVASNEVRLSTSSGTSAGDRLQMIFSAEARGLQTAAGTAMNSELFRRIRAHQAVLTSIHCADPNACVRYSPDLEGRVRDGNRLLLIAPEEPGAPAIEEVERILAELRAYEVRWLDCNPTYLANLTYTAIDEGVELPRIDVITCGFEMLTRSHRALLARAWGCPVYNRYTASEVGTFQIVECEHGSLHVNERYYYSEIVRDGRHAAPGEIGRLVQTTLQEQIPLVRYDTGDLVRAAGSHECACGSVNRTVAAIAGRASDLIAATDGTPRTTLEVDEALSAVSELRFYQVVQTAPKGYQLKVVVDRGADSAAVRARAAEALHAVVGADAQVRAEAVRHLYPAASGKFRITQSALPHPELLITT